MYVVMPMIKSVCCGICSVEYKLVIHWYWKDEYSLMGGICISTISFRHICDVHPQSLCFISITSMLVHTWLDMLTCKCNMHDDMKCEISLTFCKQVSLRIETNISLSANFCRVQTWLPYQGTEQISILPDRIYCFHFMTIGKSLSH